MEDRRGAQVVRDFLVFMAEAWDIRRPSFTRVLWLAVGILLGVVVLAGLLMPSGIEVFDAPGSAADWVAAIGTWVVGVAAFALAAGDRRLRLHERREQKMLRLKLEISQVRTAHIATNSILQRLKRARAFLGYLSENESAFDETSLYDVGVAFSEILEVVQAPLWTPDERSAANDQAEWAMVRASELAEKIKGRIRYVNDNFMSRARVRPASSNKGVILKVDEELKALSSAIERAGSALEARVQVVTRDRDRLARKLDEEFEELI